MMPHTNSCEKPPPVPEDANARLQRYLDLFPALLKDWEQKHPDWHIEVLLWILDRALHSLQGYLEDEAETEITWDNPYVELQLPVESTWTEDSVADGPRFHLTTGHLRLEDTATPEAATAAMSRLLVRHLEIVGLQDWTNHTALEKRGEHFSAVASVEAIESVKAIGEPKARERAWRALFRPKSFGAGTIDYDPLGEDGETVGLEVAEQLAAIEPPLIFLPVEVGGHKVRLITVFEINPLIADVDTKSAYFPVVIGLAIQAGIGEEVTEEWLDQPWAFLSHWGKQDRDSVWGILHRLIEEALADLGPPAEPEMEEAILSVSAKIKVTVPKGDSTAMQRAIADAVFRMQQGGELLHLTIEPHPAKSSNREACDRLMRLAKQVDEAKSNEDKGKALEVLMEALFETVPGFTVVNRVRTETEEIDLWVTNNAEAGPLRREGDVILAECKNWTGKCGKNEFIALLVKMMNRSGRCTLGFLISWNGFAETVTKEMLRGSRDELLIVPLEGDALRACCASGDFQTVLLNARQRALMM